VPVPLCPPQMKPGKRTSNTIGVGRAGSASRDLANMKRDCNLSRGVTYVCLMGKVPINQAANA
jgi:hypothetical protein